MEGIGVGIGTLVIIIVVVVVVLLIIREIVTWYWKLNKITNQLQDITHLLGLLVVHQTSGRRPQDTSITHIREALSSVESSFNSSKQ